MDYLNINKKLWDAKTNIHFDSDFYDVKSFIEGKDSLNSIEKELLGDLKGKSVLHLQCHFGMDTISLARYGAIATGVDLSGEAISRARDLANKLEVDTKFIESDVYQLPEKLNEKFDIIYTSYGVLGWLPDMEKWATIVNHFLKPGGKLVLVEFHPVVWMFSYDFSKIEFSYIDEKPIIEESEETYTDGGNHIKSKSVEWNHSLSKVINSLLKVGLTLMNFEEYDYSPYNCFENTIEKEGGKYQIKGLEEKIPMVYSVVVQKLNEE